jgi:hypothetical protein
MKAAYTANPSHPFQPIKRGSLISRLRTLVGSLLVTLQSRHMNPPYTFDVIQTRVDAFVR